MKFRCHLHGKTMESDQLREHEEEFHDGMRITVMVIPEDKDVEDE